jgi:hypothetical protein
VKRKDDILEDYHVHMRRDGETGIVIFESWELTNTSETRSLPPADPELQVMTFHRLSGPAYIKRDRLTGVSIVEQWWQRGLCHRADGPAIVYRNAVTGEITRQLWYNHGHHVRPPSRATRRLSLKSSSPPSPS